MKPKSKRDKADETVQLVLDWFSDSSEAMSRKKQRRSHDFNDAGFLGFAKSYLSEAFPNPQRIGCPPDSDLLRMAKHPVEARDATVSEHLTCCSPCFNRCMQILADLKRKA